MNLRAGTFKDQFCTDCTDKKVLSRSLNNSCTENNANICKESATYQVAFQEQHIKSSMKLYSLKLRRQAG